LEGGYQFYGAQKWFGTPFTGFGNFQKFRAQLPVQRLKENQKVGSHHRAGHFPNQF